MRDATTAVEMTRYDDSIELWVDANNNGVRDDDDVNIFVTKSGGFYTVSPTFKHALDSTIQTRIKALAVAMLTDPNKQPTDAENALRSLALELVLKATSADTAQ